jgi:hypothetical protein
VLLGADGKGIECRSGFYRFCIDIYQLAHVAHLITISPTNTITIDSICLPTGSLIMDDHFSLFGTFLSCWNLVQAAMTNIAFRSVISIEFHGDLNNWIWITEPTIIGIHRSRMEVKCFMHPLGT